MTTQVPHQLLDIPTLEIVNRKAVGDPQSSYPASWANVGLNTILLDEIGGISLSGSFGIEGLPAGKYVVSGSHVYYNSQYLQTRVWDATNANELARSTHGWAATGAGPNLILGPRKITIPTGATIAYQIAATGGLNDGSLPIQALHGFADYASIRFERVA